LFARIVENRPNGSSMENFAEDGSILSRIMPSDAVYSLLVSASIIIEPHPRDIELAPRERKRMSAKAGAIERKRREPRTRARPFSIIEKNKLKAGLSAGFRRRGATVRELRQLFDGALRRVH